VAQAEHGYHGDEFEDDIDKMDDLDDDEKEHIMAMSEFGEEHQQQILALVRNTKAKTFGKSKGKGKKGNKGKESEGDKEDSGRGKGPRDGCFICKGDHFAKDCPHKDEAAALKGKGKGDKGGKKGGKGDSWPTLQQWKQSYPFPTKGAWTGYWPGAAGKGNGSPNVNAVAPGSGSWQDTLKAVGSLIGSLDVKEDPKTRRHACANHHCACGIAGVMGILPEELPSEIPRELSAWGIDTPDMPRAVRADEPRAISAMPRAVSAYVPRAASAVGVEPPPRSVSPYMPRAASAVGVQPPPVPSADSRRAKTKMSRVKTWVKFDDAKANHNTFAVLVNEDEENEKKIQDVVNEEKLMDPDPSKSITTNEGFEHAEEKIQDVVNVQDVVNEKPEEIIRKKSAAAKKGAAAQMIRYLGEIQKEAALQAVDEGHDDWEMCEVVMDSGAHVSVGPPSLGRKAGYDVEESPGSRAGICYTAANGGELPNLGQRFMACVTEEGSIRGMEQQVCDVTKALESVRADVRAGHAIIFDDDGSGNGTGSFMVNKATGEINMIRDNGRDYIMRRWLVPQKQAPAIIANAGELGFTRQSS